MDHDSSPAATPAPTTEATAGSLPSQEPIEIDSDEENQKRSHKKSHKGVLSGINPNNILTPTPKQHTIELDGDDNETASKPSQAHQYGTRTAKHGRASDTYDKYDMKYHPADLQLRPKRAAKRHSGSRSGSRSLSVSTLRDDDQETEEESHPSSARDCDSQQVSEAEESGIDENPEREPDPRASRHSKRTEAQKYVNYSVRHHKDDHSIPGFQHKAKQLKRSNAPLDDGNTSSGNIAKKRGKAINSRNTEMSTTLLPSQSSDEVNDLVEETLLNLSQIPTSSVRTAAKLTAQNDLMSEEDGASSDAGGDPNSDVERVENGSSPESTNLREETQDPDAASNHLLPSPSSNEVTERVDGTLRNRGMPAPTPSARETAQSTAQSTAQDALNLMSDDDISSDSGGGRSGDLDRLENRSSLESITLRDETQEFDEKQGLDESEELNDTEALIEIEEPDETEDPQEPREAAVQALLQQNITSSQRTVANSSSSEEL